MNSSIIQKSSALVLLGCAAVLMAAMMPTVNAQADESLVTACGRQAKEAGVSGAAAVSAFVAKCVAEKQAQRATGGGDEDKDKDKDKKSKKDKKKS